MVEGRLNGYSDDLAYLPYNAALQVNDCCSVQRFFRANKGGRTLNRETKQKNICKLTVHSSVNQNY